MIYRDPMSAKTLIAIVVSVPIAYSAWLTSLVFCSVNDHRPLLIASAAFFPIGIIHGLGIWLFGGW